MTQSTAAKRAVVFCRMGIYPIPVGFRSKKPTLDDWPNLRITEADVPEHFPPDVLLNIGGNLSASGVIDVDLDCLEAVRLAPQFLPPTLTYGRPSKPRSHWFYRAPPEAVHKKYSVRFDGDAKPTCLVEHRAVGQSVLPGSVHESGETIAFCDAVEMSDADVSDAVRRLAVAAYLARRGWTDADAVAFARAEPDLTRLDAHGAKYVGQWFAAPKPATDAEQRSSDPRIDIFNQSHPIDWDQHGRSCPICGHHGCFGPLAGNPARWICFSASHDKGGIEGTAGWHGDAADIAAHEAGVTLGEFLDSLPELAPLALARRAIAEFRDGVEHSEEAESLMVERVRAIVGRMVDPLDRDRIEQELINLTGRKSGALALPKVRLRIQPRSGAVGATAASEDGVALLFAQEHGDTLRYCKIWGSWLQWCGNRWERERTDLPLDFCRDLARRANTEKKAALEKASFAAGVEKLAKASRAFATTPEQWDCNTWLLNTPVGVIDLQTGKLREHQPSDYLTRITQVAPKAGPMPVFSKFLREICCGDSELSGYLQQALGACLSGARSDHFLLFCIGEGSNGKNTLGDLVEKILGSYSKTIPIETLMSSKNDRHPTEMANLMGLRLAISSEVPEGSHWNEARIKSLTGDSTISARFMRADFFEFERTHKHLVYGNHRPQLRVVDEAMRRRMHIVPFKATFSDELGNKDPGLSGKLWAEAPAVLAWLIDGHMQWLRAGSLRRCEAVRRETDDYFEAQSTPDMWLAERCTVSPDARARAAELYADFNTWKQDRGEAPMSQTRWGEWMSSRFRKVKSAGVMKYEGLKVGSAG